MCSAVCTDIIRVSATLFFLSYPTFISILIQKLANSVYRQVERIFLLVVITFDGRVDLF